jgi:hypothetical protein
MKTAKEGLPIFTLFRNRESSQWVFVAGRYFSCFAIGTSIISLSMAMHGALMDVLPKKLHNLRNLFIFLPQPLAVLNPHLFLSVLGLCGGIFGNLIAGIIPMTPFIKGKRFRIYYLAIWLFFLIILFLECANMGIF